MKKVFLLACILLIGSSSYAQTWVNDALTLFNKNQAVVLTINMRTFGAVDKDRNGIIQKKKGEVSGNFDNAISRLDEISALGVNTLHLLPINPVGKRRAKGTAGSLFAVKDLTAIDSNLGNPNSNSILLLQVKDFVEACHKRNIRVLVEMPAYGAYDLYLKKPRLFLKDKTRQSIVIPMQKDLRIFNAGTGATLNMDVYNLYEKYVDLLLSIDVDGVVVQDPYLKPAKFWKKLISYTKSQNQNFVFVAEMNKSQKRPKDVKVPYIGLRRIMNTGFDVYLGDFDNIVDWKFPEDVYKSVRNNQKFQNKFANKKAVLADFNLYSNVAPIMVEDIYLSKMIIWLSSTLPVNAMYTDGFQTGDDYSFDWANLKALDSTTDDTKYYLERGKLDIYNFSRRPKGPYPELIDELKMANKFKLQMSADMPNAEFVMLNTNYPDVFCYAMTDRITNHTVFVVGSFDMENIKNVAIKVSGLNKKMIVKNVRNYAEPQIHRGKINTLLAPADIQVFEIDKFAIK